MTDPIERFEKLCDMIYVEAVEGNDCWLDPSDARLLLEGVEFLNERILALQTKDKTNRSIRRSSAIRSMARRERSNHAWMIQRADMQRAEQIAREVAERYGLTFEELRSARRFKRVVSARHEAVCLINSACKALSTPDIASVFGIDHTTVLYVLGRRKRRPKDFVPMEGREAA